MVYYLKSCGAANISINPNNLFEFASFLNDFSAVSVGQGEVYNI